MDFNFKDKKSADLFDKVSISKISDNEKNDEILYEKIFLEEKKVVVNNSKIQEDKLTVKDVSIELNLEKKMDIQNQKLNRIETQQNIILEILENLSFPSIREEKIKEISPTNMEILELNLELFVSNLIILSPKSTDKNILNLLNLLKKVSEYLMSNSFYAFTKETTPINEIITELNYLGVGSGKLNKLIDKSEILLKDIDRNAKKRVFEKSYFFANLLLEKGLLLNAITLLNETISIYIVESVKHFSKKIQEYTYIVGEKDIPMLYSHVKEFFIKNYEKDTTKTEVIPFYPTHTVIKDMDKEIIKKFTKMNTTWSHKGDGGLFQKYAYITKRVRSIRNNVAHGNLEIDYRELNHELKVLNDDFYYLSIQKNIFKYNN